MNELKDKKLVEYISTHKNENEKMRSFRLKSFEKFIELNNPKFGPKLDFNFDEITYFNVTSNKTSTSWDEVDFSINNEVDALGIKQIEKTYLDGMGVYYDSSVVYHNMISYLEELGVIFCDIDTAIKEYPQYIDKYFNNLVKYDENKYTALNGAFFSGGTFIYVPKGTKLNRPLQSYFRMDSKNIGQFERTIIVVDDDSELNYIEGCTAKSYTSSSLHAAVVEIYVGKRSKCRYTTIQNWSKDVYNLVTKRAIVDDDGLMEWIDGNVGSKATMKYPSTILNGTGASGKTISVANSFEGQDIDAGGKIIHLKPNTKSVVISKSLVHNGGFGTYRGMVKITKDAINSVSNVTCDTLLLGDYAVSNAIVDNIVENDSSIINHEASTSKIDKAKIFYLMSKGIKEEKAREIIILGFIGDFTKELPIEYSVELNNILELNKGV